MSARSLRVGYVLKVFPRLSETFVLNEILELESQGIEVEIFSLLPPVDPRFHGKLARLKAPVTYLPRPDSSEMWRQLCELGADTHLEAFATGAALLESIRKKDSGGLKPLMQGIYVATLAATRQIDHLHAHFATSATQVAMTAHQLGGVPFSFTAHAKDLYYQGRDPFLLTAALASARFAVTVTNHNVAWMRQNNPDTGHKIRKIYNGLPTDEITPVSYPNGAIPCIVSVGRLVEKKGFPYLVEACAKLRNRGRRFRCVIVGTGEQERALRELIATLSLGDNVQLAGPRNHEEVLRTIAEGHLMVLPCVVGEDGNRDALPTVLLEAMALGRPVVSTDLPGVTEIVDQGATGVLTPQRDSEALAEAIDTLLGDPDRCALFGRKARQKVEQVFDIHKNVAGLAALFEASAASRTADADTLCSEVVA